MIRSIILTCTMMLACITAYSQDSALQSAIRQVRQLLDTEAVKSASTYETHKTADHQDRVLDEIIKTARQVKTLLKTGIDTTTINKELEDILRKYKLATEGIFTNANSLQTERNLTSSYRLLHELLNRADVRKLQVDAYKRRLMDLRLQYDSLNNNPHLYNAATDSAEFVHYMRELAVAAKEISPVDSNLQKTLQHIQATKEKADLTVYTLQTALEQIDAYEQKLSRHMFAREVIGWQQDARPFTETISQSMQKEKLIWYFYFRNNKSRLFALLVLTTLSMFFLGALKQKLAARNLLNTDQNGQLVLRYPVLSSILIVLNVFQFIFPETPFVFSSMFWIISSACLTIIFLRYITTYWMIFWTIIWVLFLLACFDNLLLQASITERWLMLCLSAAGLVTCVTVLWRGDRSVLKEKSIIYFIAFIILLESASIIANLFGRFNLAKSLMTSGFISVVIAIMFLWTVRLINEALTLASDVFQTPERRLFFINFHVVGKKAPLFFYVFLVIGWFILFARNFYAFKLVTEPIEDFLFDARNVGGYDFTFFGVLAFFAILVLSSVVSRIVSFFATEPSTHAADNHKGGIGSWLLLIRIAIIVIGLVLAFAVAGIPLDKATFVMGALGVGIGFGLQSLVNNLVSGVILAFEKPLNVGDFVEVNGKSGTVKSVGFRSSIFQTPEGAHLVIPNGALLNDELTNWNNARSIRRTELIVGVSYNTDLKAAEELLKNLAMSNDRIIKSPEPSVLASDFGDSAIMLRLYFWTQGIRTGNAVKSELIIAIQQAFHEHHITIPIIQRPNDTPHT